MAVDQWLTLIQEAQTIDGGCLLLVEMEYLIDLCQTEDREATLGTSVLVRRAEQAANKFRRAPLDRRGKERLPAPPDGCYLVAVWKGTAVDPTYVAKLLSWRVEEILAMPDLADRTETRRLLLRAALGVFGRRVRAGLLARVGDRAKVDVARIVDATLLAILENDLSIPRLALRVHMSRSTLERVMKRAGLIPPGRFVQRTRVVLAASLRSDPALRSTAWRTLGFRSSGHLSSRFKSHFGDCLTDFEKTSLNRTVDELLDRLVASETRR